MYRHTNVIQNDGRDILNIKTVRGRASLPARRDPYWDKLEGTLHLGIRKMRVEGDINWVARTLDPSTGKRVFKALGVLADHPDSTRYTVAKREAEAWAHHLASGGVVAANTVADCCREYVKYLRDSKGNTAADEAAKRFARYVTNDARFAAVELTKITAPLIRTWRQRLADQPVRRGSGRGTNPPKVTDKARSAASLNRDMTPFRAALNWAFNQGWVTSDFPWRAALTPVKDAGSRRDLYLDKNQRKQLIAAAAPDVALFLRGLSVLPFRPGALAALKVADFDARLNHLRIRFDKTQARSITLPTATAALFAQQCRGKLPSAPIFARADGKAWNKDGWKRPIKAAAIAASLFPGTSAYTLRHSTITDLVRGGLDLLTVAGIAGTSVLMIQKHYGQHQPGAATEALAALAV